MIGEPLEYGAYLLGRELLTRVAAIELLLNGQRQLLEFLPARNFLTFRGHPGTASGSESAQFQPRSGYAPMWQAPSMGLGVALAAAALGLETL